jgi:hypothetical protein
MLACCRCDGARVACSACPCNDQARRPCGARRAKLPARRPHVRALWYKRNSAYRLSLNSRALAGLPLHNANLLAVVEGPGIRLNRTHARQTVG